MSSPPPRSSDRDDRLVRLLRDLGSDLRRGEAASTPPGRCPTGLPEMDRLLGGGIPRGRLSEIAGPVSCGRTSLALALLARATGAGQWTAVVDAADAFDPASAASKGTDLARVLWVRPPSTRDALRGAEHVIAARGFALILLDLVRPGGEETVPVAAWSRLRKLAAATNTALVVMGRQRLAGSFADLAVEMEAAQPRFAREPDWLEGLEGRVRIVRNRAGLGGLATAVRWHGADAAA